jgi:E3 ubiquitin-protein ligase HUWE1
MLHKCKLYFYHRINLYCTKSIEKYLNSLKRSIYKIIPSDLLSIFEPFELEMILNGPTFIDV